MISPLILIVTPRGKPGVFTGLIDGTGLTVRATRYPLVDCARALLLVGADPKTVLILRSHGSEIDRMRGQIGAIVRRVSRKGPRAPVRQFPEAARGPRGAQKRLEAGKAGTG